MTPAVSVVIPVYNGERYLASAMDSILAQSFGDFEIILVDDGSTDRTMEIVHLYRKKAAGRLRTVITRPNKGIVVSLNEGVDECRGEFIARMDADDISRPERFMLQVQYLSENPECVLVGSRVLLIDPEGAPIREWVSELTHDEIDSAHLNRQWPVVHPSVMMRRQPLQQLGGYRQQYETLEDLDLFLRLAEVGRLANLPQVLLDYRQHFSSICHTRSGQQSAIRDAILRETCQRRGLPPLSAVAPPPERAQVDCHRLWGWWALNAGHVDTARKHARATLSRAPLSLESWRLAYCAVRGH
jgi:glycosyltransferase involved in cell wall biosynthesis